VADKAETIEVTDKAENIDIADKAEAVEIVDKAENLSIVRRLITLEDERTLPFEIVRGDYGQNYVGTIEGVDYSTWTAVIYVWNEDGDTIVDGSSATTALVGSDTTVTYAPALGDFDVPAGVYHGLFKLSTSGKVERTLKFAWEVFGRELVTTTSTSTSTTSTSTSTTAPP
jgi:hypothetical protein